MESEPNISNDTVILSLGGSLIVPNGGIDTDFLSDFQSFIRSHVQTGMQFFIICGGGATARHYRDAGAAVCEGTGITSEDLDWLGIHSTRLNAHLLRTIFRDLAYPRLIKHYDEEYEGADEHSIVIGAGWKPGFSTDYCAVQLAENFGIKKIINLSNIDMVYTEDPNGSNGKEAQPIESMTWSELQELVGTNWEPGMNAPLDPIATQKAKKIGLEVIIANGRNLKNLQNLLEGDEFTGTQIK